MLIEFHRRMLADEVRSAAFEAALRRVIVPGTTTVADIGAGTGVLGLMAQRLGAREVHLIEHGGVIELAARVADANRMPGLHFWEAHSAEIIDPPQVDVVVAEILGNLALEENALETLVDARRFLKSGGTLIPARLEQFAAPLVSARFWHELASWDRAPLGLDFRAARAMSFDNVYVREIAPADLLPGAAPARCWDAIDFATAPTGRRSGSARWEIGAPATVHGFALWWDCELVPGVRLATSPFAPPTHWGQVYAPLEEPLALVAGDVLVLEIEAETGGGEDGIAMRWRATQHRGRDVLNRREHDVGRGFIG
jgi:protein arginine N-methyltransferase 1